MKPPSRIFFEPACLLSTHRHSVEQNGRLIVTIAVYLRRMSAGLAVVGLAVLGPAVLASAAPTFTFKTAALPIPGFPGTGDILGAGAVIQVEGKISGTEYGGFPPPLIGIRYFAPAGAKVHPQGVATCARTVVESHGPEACPKKTFP